MSSIKEPVKKGPGRPKKIHTEIDIDNRGIVDTPSDSEYVVEMTYCNQKFFKRIFKLFKTYGGVEIKFCFSPSQVKIICHGEKQAIITTIDCRKVNLYYCREEHTVVIHRDNLNKIFAHITKVNFKITFIVEESQKDNKFLIRIDDIEHGNSSDFYIDQIVSKDVYRSSLPEYEEYPISFSVKADHLKKKVEDIAKNSAIMNINKAGSEFLEITYPKIDQTLLLRSPYRNPEKIDLKCTLDDTDIVSSSIEISNISPFSKSLICERVRLYVDNNRELVMVGNVDERESGPTIVMEVYIQPYVEKNI